MEKSELILKELQLLNRRVNEFDSNMVTKRDLESVATKKDLENMVTKQDFEQLSKKLDAVASQVAHNPEQEVILRDVSQKVKDHETDIRLIKRMMTNK
ncbi:hypothetical protein [Halalkalibacter alkalisediminis]|uniref:Uncharacterized protein n=1 Tax=Halalkalibacter alkalisediminis TaxID=935616 RepID=A0ABV6NJF9_9BACI|nr:hypothetical protein [Halalkalibacter alkalisediminis]